MDYRIILGIIIIGIVIVVLATDTSGSILMKGMEQFAALDWDEVRERDIVKNSIPVNLLDETDQGCKVTANHFDQIIDHVYFVKAEQLANELKYDKENKTLIIPCEFIQDEKSRLNIWYVITASPKHAEKYEYFVTEWEE